MSSISNARLAGLLYLIVVITGIFTLAYVPSRIMVAGDGAATVANIVAMEPLFRAGIAIGILCYLAFLLLPLAFYRLLEPAGPVTSRLMVLSAIVSVPMALLNLGNDLDVLTALRLGNAEQAAAHLTASRNGQIFVQLFWGLWLLPLGLLIVRSAAIPRAFGILLMWGASATASKCSASSSSPTTPRFPAFGMFRFPGVWARSGPACGYL